MTYSIVGYKLPMTYAEAKADALDRLADIMEAKPNSPGMWIGVGGYLGHYVHATHDGAEIVFTHVRDNKRVRKQIVQEFLDAE